MDPRVNSPIFDMLVYLINQNCGKDTQPPEGDGWEVAIIGLRSARDDRGRSGTECDIR
jgi:hypothetical protein